MDNRNKIIHFMIGWGMVALILCVASVVKYWEAFSYALKNAFSESLYVGLIIVISALLIIYGIIRVRR